jgi:hypothetical protein
MLGRRGSSPGKPPPPLPDPKPGPEVADPEVEGPIVQAPKVSAFSEVSVTDPGSANPEKLCNPTRPRDEAGAESSG